MTEIIIKVDDKFLEFAKMDGMEDQYELIRCKDCKHYADECCDRYADETLGYVHSTQEYGYCWVAERKEE